jgi:hypothetical protein
MVRVWLTSFLAVAVIWVTACVAAAQVGGPSPRNAGIELKVVDVTGAVVPGAEVSLSSDGNKEEQTGKTDERGEFHTPILAPGSYLVKVRRPGFKLFKKQVDVSEGSTSKVRAELMVAPTIDHIYVPGPIFIDSSATELRPQFPSFELWHRQVPALYSPQPPSSTN